MTEIDELIQRWKGDSFEVTYKDRLIKQLIEKIADRDRLARVSLDEIRRQENHYGYCPKCSSPSISRERRINGNDKCDRGHIYPSDCAMKEAGE